jgi:predicted RNA-binding protein (TIGR00451 family)
VAKLNQTETRGVLVENIIQSRIEPIPNEQKEQSGSARIMAEKDFRDLLNRELSGTENFAPETMLAKAIEVKNEENERFVFLTLRGFLEHDDAAKWVEVDHGAIPFLMKGADCMVAGVHAADASIEVGDLVWIRDMKHKRPLAIGWATMNADDLTNLSKGKGIKTLHWVGDELWDMEP